MQKVLKIFVIVAVILSSLTIKAYALDLNAELQTERSQYSKGDEVVVNLNISSISNSEGVISMQGELSYNESEMTLSKIEGQNGWDTPVQGVTMNNGKIVITRNGLANQNETVLKMTFKLNDNISSDPAVTINSLIFADGTASSDAMKRFDSIATTIRVGGSSSSNNNGGSSSNNGGTNAGGFTFNSNNGSNGSGSSTGNAGSSSNNRNSSNGNLPQTGEEDKAWIGVAIVILAAGAIFAIYRIARQKRMYS